MPQQMRQGDLLFIKHDTYPAGLPQISPRGKKIVLAEGETSGHTHTIEREALVADPMRNIDGGIWMVVAKAAPVEHQEHDPIKLDPGVWEVRQQQEESPEGRRLPRFD